MLDPGEHAAAIISHYLRALTERAGLRWTPQNAADMQTLARLIDQLDQGEPQDTIPPYQAPVVSDRQTVVLERDDYERQQWYAFHRWQTERAEDERVEQARRIVTRR
jgi:hypothetical protein